MARIEVHKNTQAEPPLGSAPGAVDRPLPASVPAGGDPREAQAAPVDTVRKRRVPGWVAGSIGWVISLLAHMSLLLFLGLWVVPVEAPTTPPEGLEIVSAEQIEPETEEKILESSLVDVQVETELSVEVLAVTDSADETQEFLPFDEPPSPAPRVEMSDLGRELAVESELLKSAGAAYGNALAGRGAGARAELARQHGGTPGSEKAVGRALKWLERHQLPDGGWSLDHRIGACQGRCSDPGLSAPARNAATALALLPFLGAGQTHTDGNYKETVGKGLHYLTRSIQISANAGSFHEPGGTMYSHGLAAIALCEAYAMTQDKYLLAPAQLALNFISLAQDPVGGGWRYEPRQPGDTSVAGWQLMALKSGHMAFLDVPRATVAKANRFLDSVQKDGGAFYGYVEPGRERRFGTTAIGILCRLHLGWKPDRPALERGVNWISKHGPATDDLYGNYYATQVMFHTTGGTGELWQRWNNVIREQLVSSQSLEGHAEGSWYVPSNHSNEAGGRLYCTSLAAMILEIYYRHMPIYGEIAADDDFPL